MPRVKGGQMTHKRHKKMLASTKGYKWHRSKLWRHSKQAWMKAGLNMYRGRKLKKRDFRRLWISRVNAACRAKNMTYSCFIDALTKKYVILNRKMLAEIAVHHPEVMEKLLSMAKP